MSRSSRKGPFVDERLMKKVGKTKPGTKAVIKTWARSSVIAPEMVGITFGVHNGRQFTDVFVKEEMVGHRLGEFAPTRKFIKHGGKIQKALEQAAAMKEAEQKSAAQAPAEAAKK